jgi:mono/diheme cytochrome c family protein
MLRRLAIVLAVLLVLGAGLFWVLTIPATIASDALGPHRPDLANGETMFHAGMCASCHVTPRQDDRTRLGGGLALRSPFGTFYVPNISPHPTDGIGTWSDAQFVTAMVKGTSPGGEHYYPSFPYTSYQRMTLGDLRDLFAYIKTLPPVPGRIRGHDLPFPFNLRRPLGIWKLVYLDGTPFHPDPAQSAAWNRGAYLVQGPGHCAECHSPRDVLGGIIERYRFAGGPNPEGEGWIPNITQYGLKDWTADDIAAMLDSGLTPEGDSVGGSMASVVRNTARLSADDRAAIGLYVRSLPPVPDPPRPSRK